MNAFSGDALLAQIQNMVDVPEDTDPSDFDNVDDVVDEDTDGNVVVTQTDEDDHPVLRFTDALDTMATPADAAAALAAAIDSPAEDVPFDFNKAYADAANAATNLMAAADKTASARKERPATSAAEDNDPSTARNQAKPHKCPFEGCKVRGKSEVGIKRHIRAMHKD
jgi:hypothetical protein